MEKTVTKSHDTIVEHYNKADASGKKILAELFGKEVNLLKITDRVKTFEDACRELSIDPLFVGIQLQAELEPIHKDAASLLAYLKLIIIARALNEGWEPNWADSYEYKYVALLGDYSAGVGFSGAVYDGWLSGTGVGSRLCYKTRELAMYAGTQFRDVYNEFFLIK